MTTVDLAKKRVVDFNSQTCELKDNRIMLLSPLVFIEGNNFYLPEKVRMPNGTINENVVFDWSFSRALEEWEGDSLSMYVGKNYLQTIDNWAKGYITDREKVLYLYLPKVINIFLYDKEIDGCTSKNGILYCGEEAVFVPDRNPYAESMPLTPVHGMYEDDYSSIDGIDLEGCGRDMFGGIYSLDGKSFIRWDGHDFVKSYRIRNGVREIREKAFRKGRGSGLSINTIYLPETLERIGREAFMSCRLIKELSLPANVVDIEERAFHNCQSLESVTLSPNLHIIGKEAFSSTGLKSILIPNSVLYIGDKCFDNCWQLSSIKVEEGNQNYSSDDGMLYNSDKSVLLRIPPLLFPDSEHNTNLKKEKHEKEIICGFDVIVKYENLFEGITFVTKKDARNGNEFKEIIMNKDVSLCPQVLLLDNNNIVIGVWDLSVDSRIYVDDGEFVKSGNVIGMEWEYPMEVYYGPSRKEYTIKEFVKTLADGALQRSSFKKLIIPQNVECIGTDQFNFCDVSEIIVSPENEYYEFRDNSLIDKKSKKLLHWFGKEKDIVIPEGVEIIGERAFDFYEFKSLVIPEGVKCIEDSAFWCSEHGFSIYLPSSLCYVAPNAFYGLNGMRDYNFYEYNIYVPHGLKQKYMKLLDCYEREIKEMDSDSIDDFKVPDCKELAIVTEEDLAQAIIDEDGNKYSKDKKRFLKAEPSIVHVEEGTEVICDDAIWSDVVHIPSTVRYVGIDGIFSDRLVIDGKDTYIGGLNLCDLNTIYIPCGTWAKYYSLIESNMIHSKEVQCGIEEDGFEDFKVKFDEYRMVELSKANVSMYLQQQRDILISIINSTDILSEYNFVSINGDTSKDFVCFRIANVAYILYIENRNFVCDFANTFFILGYTLQDVCDLLGIRIREIEVNEDNKETIIGHKLARRVWKNWMEDFVDEDSGEVVPIERSEMIFDRGHTIEENDVHILLDGGPRNIVVYDNNSWAPFPVSSLISALPTSEKELSVNPQTVLGLLFPRKVCSELSVDEKLFMAYNLLVAFKAADFSGRVEDVLMPFKIKPEERHTKVTSEESKLINLISEFYNQKISAIMDCNTDLDVMPLFSTDKEIYSQLEAFLTEKGISEWLINSYVKQLFDTLDL